MMKWMFLLTVLLLTSNQLVECNNANKNKNNQPKTRLLNGNRNNRNTFDGQDGKGGSFGTTILSDKVVGNNDDAEFEKFLAEFNRKKSTMNKNSVGGGGNGGNGGYSFLNYLLSDAESKRDVNCQNPDQEYLENQYSEYQRFYRKFEETLLKSKGDMRNTNYRLGNYSFDNLLDESQCNINDRNTTSVNKRSICPWKYVISGRVDKFPPIKTEAKCTCSKCTTFGNKDLPENMYNCMPVMKSIPVLVKGECGPDGYFTWTPSTEEINVACICGLTHAWFPES